MNDIVVVALINGAALIVVALIALVNLLVTRDLKHEVNSKMEALIAINRREAREEGRAAERAEGGIRP